ncbi:hypothetical protein PV779_39645, partial [Streptomyces sp. ID01-9D]|nr:hypothetical protein [Streptomyces sp. ID01-9D]
MERAGPLKPLTPAFGPRARRKSVPDDSSRERADPHGEHSYFLRRVRRHRGVPGARCGPPHRPL